MKLVFTEEGQQSLTRLDGAVARRIVAKLIWLTANFDQQVPDALGAELVGFFKLRVGDWRIIYSADRIKQTLTIHLVDHRSKVYKRR